MSTQQGKWREEQVLIICPGSQTTLAQIGCSELTPPAHRFPTRMFKDEDSDDWRPYHTYKRKKEPATAANGTNGDAGTADEDEWEYVEDPDSSEGAVYPIHAGRIVNMEVLLAFLDHVHSTLTTTYHNTPIVLMASPQWTRPDCEELAQYIFEKTKTPALCLINSAIATQYGLKWPNLTVVDVGFEKVDVTCIYDSRVVSHLDVGTYPDPDHSEEGISGGEVFTRRLHELLKKKGFTYEMAEQLKKSPVCEVLPYVPENPNLMDLPYEGTAAGGAPKTDDDDGVNGDGAPIEEEGVLDVANIVASGQTREFLAKKEKEKAEKGKAGRKGKDKDEAAPKASKLPNSKRVKNVFHYEEFVTEEVPPAPVEMPPPPRPVPAPGAETSAPSRSEPTANSADQTAKPAAESNAAKPAEPAPSQSDSTKDVEMGEASAAAPESAPGPDAAKGTENSSAAPNGTDASSGDAVKSDQTSAPAPEAPPAPAAPQSGAPEHQIKRVRRDVEVGLERFTFAERAEIDRIVTTIYRAVQGIEDMYMRPQCWENIVFVGNGSRVRGLKENIMQTLQARHLISPSSATMFTSELPSNLGTPSGTGSQTPTASFTGPPHLLPSTSSVNPLLQAATTANLGVPGGPNTAPGSNAGDVNGTSHHFHSQTPTNIKLAQLPTYLSEWTKNGFEESMFLGAQVAARLAYTIHNLDAAGVESQRLLSLNRVDYNELGPKGVRTHSMLG